MTFFLLSDWQPMSHDYDVVKDCGHELVSLSLEATETNHIIVPEHPSFVIHCVGGHKIIKYSNIRNFRYVNFFTE